jgi:hypothetical protein
VAFAIDDVGTLWCIAPQVRAQVGNFPLHDQEAARLVAVGGGIYETGIYENGTAGVL